MEKPTAPIPQGQQETPQNEVSGFSLPQIDQQIKNPLDLVSQEILIDLIRRYSNAQAFPVSAIFFTVDSTNPATILGYGTWTAWGAGRVPVGVDGSQGEFDTVEETGGAKTHQLSIGELPSHTHPANNFGGASGAWGVTAGASYGTVSGATGGDQAHNNLQPYITCYMWKRTA